MWDRKTVKQNARFALQGRYGLGILVALTATLPGLVVSLISTLTAPPLPEDWPMGTMTPEAQRWYGISWITSLLVTLLISYPLAVGYARFFVHNRFGHTEYATVFSGFRDGYGSSILTMFVTDLFVALWTLLLIVPGIIKLIQYSMVPFLLSDNPHLSGGRVRQMSREMTYGHKGAIFVLYLSFFGWYVLLGFAVALVTIFSPLTDYVTLSTLAAILLAPYYQASLTEVYLCLRDSAIARGAIDPRELRLAPAQGPIF